ncbi:hypothetical protein SAMN04488556_0416 [Halostagnicola kamekurae]|uniref:Uncharacterized protein n=1 Tax=Halostagnicola kamekurae TaxID=619731 RepID=A0A1I6P9X5_9EURY|nr:hypothetical protein SAMN04488556_0416 [Halostagnicola kamekurae]
MAQRPALFLSILDGFHSRSPTEWAVSRAASVWERSVGINPPIDGKAQAFYAEVPKIYGIETRRFT